MKKSTINMEITIDEKSIPEKITWNADDHNNGASEETKAVNLSIWDIQNKNTLRIDLWTKEMPVHEMKQFYIDSVGGLAQSILNATGDEYMSSELNKLCDEFVKHLKKEI